MMVVRRVPGRSAFEEICDRLAAWAHWIHTGRAFPVGYQMRSVEARLRDEGGAVGSGARVAVPNPECEEIERLVRRLPPELKAALVARYVLRCANDRQRARHCGTAVTEYHQRLRCARYCLWGMLAAT